MILLTGIPSEAPLDLVVKAAGREGIPFALFNQRGSHYYDIALSNNNGQIAGVIRIDETEYRLEDFAGIYVRLMDHNFLPETIEESILQGNTEEIRKTYIVHDLLQIWFECTTSRIMNRGSDMGSNLSKPYQAQLIRSVGFSIPDTLVTNNKDVLEEFTAKHKNVIYKSISSVRSIVQKLNGRNKNELNRLIHLPTQFQEYIPGIDIRVHVAGDTLFATKVESPAVDYRYAGHDGQSVEMKAYELPPSIQEKCFRLSEFLKLPLCGIDLRLTPEEQYYCFEVNPCPGYSYYQEQTGQDIATAIVRYLEFGTASGRQKIRAKEVANADYTKLDDDKGIDHRL